MGHIHEIEKLGDPAVK